MIKGSSSRPTEVSEMLLEKDPDQAKRKYRCEDHVEELLSYAATTNSVLAAGSAGIKQYP